MGVEASKAIRAKQRERAARVERLIARHDQRGEVGRERRNRIGAMVREGRRALRARDVALGAVADSEIRVGAALARIAAEGLSLNHAYEALGLSRNVGRRLVQSAVPVTAQVRPCESTGRASRDASGTVAGQGETGVTTQVGATARGVA
jgi:hypothetical protein